MSDADRFLADERLEGLDEIRRAIDPTMSERTFRRKWRRRIDCILMEHENWWLRPDKKRYFTFRRLLYGQMLRHRKI